MKELLKSDSICQSYAQMKNGPVISDSQLSCSAATSLNQGGRYNSSLLCISLLNATVKQFEELNSKTWSCHFLEFSSSIIESCVLHLEVKSNHKTGTF